MMRRILRSRCGATALEFALVAMPFFVTLFGIFDLGRYALTMHSMGTLASATARAVIITCYAPNIVQNQSPSACTTDPLSDSAKRNIAPALYLGGAPSVSISANNSALVVQVSEPAFTMLMPFWGTGLNSPSASVTLPY